MTKGKNIEIHTCTKCGALCYEFEPVGQHTRAGGSAVAWALGGVLLGLIVASAIDRNP